MDESRELTQDRSDDEDTIGGILSEDTVILSIDVKSQKLAATCFDYSSRKLSILEDTQLCGSYEEAEVIESLVSSFSPSVILINSRLSEDVMATLTSNRDECKYSVQFKSYNEYSKANALKVIDLITEYLPDVYDNESEKLNITSILNSLTSSTELAIALGTFGVLIKAVEGLLSRSTELGIGSLIGTAEIISLKDTMFIDENSLYSLQVLTKNQNKSHGSKHVKDSVLSLLNFTNTRPGLQLLKSWLMRPLTSIDKINERHNTIEVLMKSENSNIRSSIVQSLRKMENISRTLLSLKSGKVNLKNWVSLQDFLAYSISICHDIMCLVGVSSSSLLENAKEHMETNLLVEIHHILDTIIDFNSSKELNKVVIFKGIDDTLDEFRHTYNEMDGILESLAYDISKSFPEKMKDSINALYIPQLGYLISLNLEIDSVPGEWKEAFRTATTIYYKTREVEEMDEFYGDVYALMGDREIELLHELQTNILQSESMMLQYFEIFTELDCLCSLARAAEEYKYVRPTLSQSNIINIKNGRHPIYENLVPSYVANDIRIGLDSQDKCDDSGSNNILVLTGANLSGKSVYLSQCTLIVLMAQSGSFVPASSATIGITDKILTRIMTRETISKHSSTFALDAQQMSKCIRLCTERSLLVIDEFGKGTDSIDGPALFGSVLEYFSKMGSSSPRIVAATQFHELFKNNILANVSGLKYHNMSILLRIGDGRNTGNDRKITYLYCLKDGLAEGSFGIYCAEFCGVNPSIIERANMFVKMIENGEDPVLVCSKLSDSETQMLESSKMISKGFLGLDLEAIEEFDDTKVSSILQNLVKILT